LLARLRDLRSNGYVKLEGKLAGIVYIGRNLYVDIGLREELCEVEHVSFVGRA
jgi:hypothetical protein